MIQASQFALNQNHALLENFHKLQPTPNHPKEPIYFMKGDPTEFGHADCKMSEEGYEIVRNQIRAPTNHSYCHATGTQVARAAVAKHFSHGKAIDHNDVIITAGVNQGLLYSLWAICNPGSNILVPELGYPFFDRIAPAYGVEVRKYALLPNQNWEIDMDDLNKQLDDKTAFLFVINPSNPCGSVFSRDHVKAITKWASDNCVLLVADEVYYGMSFGDFTSFGEVADEGPVICLSGLEKTFFVPGWQTSWIIIYDKNHLAQSIKQAYGTVCQLLLHSNVFLMNSLPDLLDKLTINYGKSKCLLFKQNQDLILQNLSDIKQLKLIPAQGTFYMTVLIDHQAFKFSDDVEFAQTLLKEENVMLLPLSWNGTNKYQGFRLLTIANQKTYEQLFDRLKQFIGRHSK